ncbi:MAG: HD domain-containing protein [Microgenomates group bacterium]
MIPTSDQAIALWQTYALPEQKQKHSLLVARVARWIATQIEQKKGICISKELVYVAGLLHDIDKNISGLPGETHPDCGVRILTELGYDEVAGIVRTHPLHAILDSNIAPKSLEEKIVYLADKMTKYEVISVDERFHLWEAEHITPKEQKVLRAAYPKAKQIEAELCSLMGMDTEEMIKTCKNAILQQE